MYTTNTFLEDCLKDVRPKKNMVTCRLPEIHEVQMEGRQRLGEVLGIPRLYALSEEPVSSHEEERERFNGYERIRYTVGGIRHLPFPIYVLKPLKSNGITILYLHGHDDLGVMGALTERHDKERYHHLLPLELVSRGYTVAAPECMGFGECRYIASGMEKNGSGCFLNAGILSMCGLTLAGVRTVQTQKAIGFIRKEGLPDAIVLFGVSGGAMTANMVNALDDGRLRGTVLAAYPNSYEDSIFRKEHCVENYVPDICSVGDSYEIMGLGAPRPLLVVNGDSDRGFTLDGTRHAIAYLRKVYERMGKDDCFNGVVFEGKHEINVKHVLAWMEKMKAD